MKKVYLAAVLVVMFWWVHLHSAVQLSGFERVNDFKAPLLYSEETEPVFFPTHMWILWLWLILFFPSFSGRIPMDPIFNGTSTGESWYPLVI